VNLVTDIQFDAFWKSISAIQIGLRPSAWQESRRLLIQNVKVKEKEWAHPSRSMQTEIVNRVTDALFDELLQDSSRISVTLMTLPISES
jgi:phenylpyruvate tautomerase PptA (4-oxalocrotonate tautomerase family)